jgi:hypothetical protein
LARSHDGSHATPALLPLGSNGITLGIKSLIPKIHLEFDSYIFVDI